MNKIVASAAVALLVFLSVQFVCAQDFDPEKQAQIAKLLPRARISLEEALTIGAREGRPIAAGFEIDRGRLNLWVFVRKGGRFLELTLDYDSGEIVAAELITKREDLRNANSENQAVARAKMSLREATEKAMEENIGFRAVEITPRLDDGTPRAKIVLNRGEEFREISQDLGLIEKPAEDSKEDAAVDADIARADPWKPFNQKTFWFNLQIDRFVFRPVATVYNAVLPGPVRQGIANALDNLNVTRRLVNNILQLKFAGAGRELSRFVINSSMGLVGLFDIADTGFGIRQSKRDTGQTLGVYGIGAGPYLVLPFLPPLTVRDFFGFAADEAMEPLDYFIPSAASIAIGVTGLFSDRAADIDSFWGVEETTPDLYETVRDAYLQRREFAVRK